MTWRTLVLALPALVAVAGCDLRTGPGEERTYSFDFARGTLGWTAHFSDYPVGAEASMQLRGGLEPLPAGAGDGATAMMLSGVNHSDDVFLYMRRYVPGLFPRGSYRVRFDVTFATSAPAGCVGTGGAPGESVVVKAGAAPITPAPEVRDGAYRLTVDKGEQQAEGTQALVLGDVATTNTACATPRWEMKTLSSGSRGLAVTADVSGGVWLYVGVESGFEGATTVYFTDVTVTVERVF